MKTAAALPNKYEIKIPVQERSRKTQQKVVEAARELFTELGFEETTMHLIAKRAGLSVGGVYAHFKNKEDIFLHILEVRSRQAYETTLDCLKTVEQKKMPIEDALEYLFSTWYEAHTRHGKLNMEMNRFCMMNQTAGKIHNAWEKEESENVKAFMKNRQIDSIVEDMDAAITVIARSTHEVFHYLYRKREQVDEMAVLSSLITMVKKFLHQ